MNELWVQHPGEYHLSELLLWNKSPPLCICTYERKQWYSWFTAAEKQIIPIGLGCPPTPSFFRSISVYFNTWPTFWEFRLDASQRIFINWFEDLIQCSPENCLAFSLWPTDGKYLCYRFFVCVESVYIIPKTDTKPTTARCAGCMTHILPWRPSGLIKCLNDLLGQMIIKKGTQFVLPTLNNFTMYMG